MKYLIIYLFVFANNFLAAQPFSEIQISFSPTYNNTLLSLDNSFDQNIKKDNIQIEVLKFYISQLELYDGEKLVFAEKNSFHLIDAADTNSLTIYLNVPNNLAFSHLKFNLGIDSLTNVSGAFGGNLDPTNGMYWAWQSGYINFKMEGVSELCPTRNNQFQFHLGGYQHPFNTLQDVVLKTLNSKIIIIDVAVDTFLAQLDLKETYQIMSPSKQAVELSQLAATIFSISK